jgi:hypothetical protein
MQKQPLDSLPQFLERLGIDEEPMGVFYSEVQKKIERSKKT